VEAEGSTSIVAQLGDFAMELATRIQDEYGDDAELGEIIIVTEVLLAEGVQTEMISSEVRPHVVKAILNEATEVAFEFEIGVDEDDEV